MKHLGDIALIQGSKVPLVDIVCGGDLSVAGKRKGLEGARSGLFMEQIRIIKEMTNERDRKKDNAKTYRDSWIHRLHNRIFTLQAINVE